MTTLPPPAEIQTLFEDLNENSGFYIRGAHLLEAGRSAYQDYEVWDTPGFGKLFKLDGYFMTSEMDEFFYHENLIHVAAITHPQPETALIIGGGDGGSAEELFKYPSMQSIVLVELDAKIIEIARTYLDAVHHDALDDPRLEIRIEDGMKYVREIAPATNRRFDLIVLDLTDPIGPAEALYSETFLRACKALLTPQGALTLHLGSPVYQPERLRALIATLRTVFRIVHPYFMYIPLYGSLWSMACAADQLDPTTLHAEEIDARIHSRQITYLQYYNGAIHTAQFAQPNYIRTLLKGG